jgi:hypothetical protein
MSESNPLKQYFRQPAIYIRLPSNGQGWPAGSLALPSNGELPVYPMTAIDEITYRTPDALFNGQAVIDVIQSCIPAIRDAWAAPLTDINSILVAIRIASYGHNMEFDTQCPKCNNEDSYDLDLRSVMDQLRSPDYSQTITHGDLEIRFRSMNYREQNSTNLEQFENQQMVRAIPTSDLPDDEKVQRMTEVMKSITRLTVKALTNSIASIRAPDAQVSESAHIEEFLNNCDRALFTRIRDHVISLRQNTDIKPVPIKCTNCSNEYEQGINLDMANFFAPAS